MEDLDLEISDDHLAEALLQLREVSGPERRWTTTENADPIVGPGPTVVGKSKPRLPWVLLKTFTGPTSNEDAVRNLLPVAELSGKICQNGRTNEGWQKENLCDRQPSQFN